MDNVISLGSRGVPIIGARDNAANQRNQQVAAYTAAAKREAEDFLRLTDKIKNNPEEVEQAYRNLLETVTRLEELGLPDTIVANLQQAIVIIEGYINGIEMAVMGVE